MFDIKCIRSADETGAKCAQTFYEELLADSWVHNAGGRSQLFASCTCCVAIDPSDSNRAHLNHFVTDSTKREFCHRIIDLPSLILGVRFPSTLEVRKYSVLLVMTNGELMFWYYDRSRSSDAWCLVHQVSLLQWEHTGARILSVTFSRDGSTVYWCEECSLGDKTYRNICSAAISNSLKGRPELCDVMVIVEDCPVCDLYILETGLFVWPRFPSPPDLYLYWRHLERVMDVRVLRSSWSVSERPLGQDPFKFDELATRGRCVWAQRSPSQSRCVVGAGGSLYVLHSGSHLLRIQESGKFHWETTLKFPAGNSFKIESALLCEKNGVVVVGCGNTVFLFRSSDGVSIGTVVTPGGEEVTRLSEVFSPFFLVLVETDTALNLLKMDDMQELPQKATNSKSVNDEFHQMMAALYKLDPVEVTQSKGVLQAMLNNKCHRWYLNNILGDGLEHFLSLEDHKSKINMSDSAGGDRLPENLCESKSIKP